jgi:hypothetical protein
VEVGHLTEVEHESIENLKKITSSIYYFTGINKSNFTDYLGWVCDPRITTSVSEGPICTYLLQSDSNSKRR